MQGPQESLPKSGAASRVVDTVVVGSGLSGLVAARRLALAGQRVALIERGQAVGGHLLPFQRGPFVFEVGLHYVADCGPGSLWQQAWSDLDVRPLVCDPLDDPFERIVTSAGAGLSQWPALRGYRCSLEDHLVSLWRALPHHKPALSRLHDDLELVWSFTSNLKFPVTKSGALKHWIAGASTSVTKHLRLLRLSGLTAWEYFATELGLPDAVLDYFLLHHMLIGTCPKSMDAFRFLLVQRYYFEESCTVRGGGRALIEALRHDDVEERCGAEVVAIFDDVVLPCDDRSTSGRPRFVVEIAGDEDGERQQYVCSDIIWTPDPRQLLRVCRFSLPLMLRLQLSRARDPHALAIGYFGLNCDPAECGLGHANYWLLGKMSACEAYTSSDLVELARHAPVYVSPGRKGSFSGTDVAGGTLQAMLLVPPESKPWGADTADAYRLSERSGGFRRAYLRHKKDVLDALALRIGEAFPGLLDQVAHIELGTPLTHRRYLFSESLGGYGYASSREDLIWSRPSFKSGRSGLYLAGAHTLPSHGILTALLSGLGVARSIAETWVPERGQHPPA